MYEKLNAKARNAIEKKYSCVIILGKWQGWIKHDTVL